MVFSSTAMMLFIIRLQTFFLQTVVNIIVDPIKIFDNRVECGGVNTVFGADLEWGDALIVEQAGGYLLNFQALIFTVTVLFA